MNAMFAYLKRSASIKPSLTIEQCPVIVFNDTLFIQFTSFISPLVKKKCIVLNVHFFLVYLKSSNQKYIKKLYLQILIVMK